MKKAHAAAAEDRADRRVVRRSGMPLYEYICEQDGTVVETQRPMADADKPLPDPQGKGRTFKRKFSTFAARGGSAAAAPGSAFPLGGCCPCGKPGGGCGAN